NLVLDVEKDKKGGLARTRKKSLEVINSASESLDLIDAWRVLNPDSSRFTWRQKKPEIHCRLDFFLINQCTFYNTVDPGLLWEMVKMKVRDVSIKYGTTKKRRLRKQQEQIEISRNSLPTLMSMTNKRNKYCAILRKRELETIIEYQTKRAILRSKSRWYMKARKTLSI
ncbi:unnamed protein product, partial [Porites lobata]